MTSTAQRISAGLPQSGTESTTKADATPSQTAATLIRVLRETV